MISLYWTKILKISGSDRVQIKIVLNSIYQTRYKTRYCWYLYVDQTRYKTRYCRYLYVLNQLQNKILLLSLTLNKHSSETVSEAYPSLFPQRHESKHLTDVVNKHVTAHNSPFLIQVMEPGATPVRRHSRYASAPTRTSSLRGPASRYGCKWASSVNR